MKFWRNKILKYSLLIFFLGYWVSVTQFTHTHIVDGVTIVHSHPFNPFSKENPSNQQHSKSLLVLISHLSHFISTAVIITTTAFLANKLLILLTFKLETQDYYAAFLFSNGLRAPPQH